MRKSTCVQPAALLAAVVRALVTYNTGFGFMFGWFGFFSNGVQTGFVFFLIEGLWFFFPNGVQTWRASELVW